MNKIVYDLNGSRGRDFSQTLVESRNERPCIFNYLFLDANSGEIEKRKVRYFFLFPWNQFNNSWDIFVPVFGMEGESISRGSETGERKECREGMPIEIRSTVGRDDVIASNQRAYHGRLYIWRIEYGITRLDPCYPIDS